MAKWSGKIGYAETKEIEIGLYQEVFTEKSYYGDVISDMRKRMNTGKVNDDIDISNTISIIADPYAMENFSKMAYAIYMGTKWKIERVEVQFPRLLLSLGGVYNVQQN